MQDKCVLLPKGVASTSVAAVQFDSDHESKSSAVTIQTGILSEINGNLHYYIGL